MTERHDENRSARQKSGAPKHAHRHAEERVRKAPATGKPEAAAHFEEELSRAQAALQEKSTQCEEYLDALRRLQADFENYRKRMVREQTQFLERAVEGFALRLLPIIDNLERAIVAADEKHDVEQLSEGVKLVHSQILDLFRKEGIEVLDPVGEPFDPTMHHAMLSVKDAGVDDGTVLEVIQKGYLLKGKVVRPAMVKVSRKPE